MVRTIPETDEELDVLWRAVFGQPLPLLGAPKIAGAILAQHLARHSNEAGDDLTGHAEQQKGPGVSAEACSVRYRGSRA